MAAESEATSGLIAMHPKETSHSRPRVRGKLLLSLLVVASLAAAGRATYALFAAQTINPSATFATGTVVLTDNDLSVAMLSLSDAVPGATDTSCIAVDYRGSLASSVKLYATVTGSLAPYLTLTVTRGTDLTPTFDSCTSFNADSTNYIGAGAGVVYSGPLSGYPTSYGSGITDPIAASPETWTSSETHSYKLTVTLQNHPAAQGQSSTATFAWEAQNL